MFWTLLHFQEPAFGLYTVQSLVSSVSTLDQTNETKAENQQHVRQKSISQNGGHKIDKSPGCCYSHQSLSLNSPLF